MLRLQLIRDDSGASVREATLSDGQLTEIHRDPKQGDSSLAMYYLKYKVLTLHTHSTGYILVG